MSISCSSGLTGGSWEEFTFGMDAAVWIGVLSAICESRSSSNFALMTGLGTAAAGAIWVARSGVNGVPLLPRSNKPSTRARSSGDDPLRDRGDVVDGVARASRFTGSGDCVLVDACG